MTFSSSNSDRQSLLFQMNVLGSKPSMPRDLTFDSIDHLRVDDHNEKSIKLNGHSRSSIKSLITKRFRPLASAPAIDAVTSSSARDGTKPKKQRKSVLLFLKRSHSTNTDLSTVGITNARPETVDVISKHNPLLKPSAVSQPASGASLRPISEEDGAVPVHQRLPTADRNGRSTQKSPHSLSKNNMFAKRLLLLIA